MNVIYWFTMFIDTITSVISKLNEISLGNGVATVGFFTIMIGFVILNILIANFRK